MKILRKLPRQSKEVETGGLQFGTDKPGIYFTGQTASYCADILTQAVPHVSDAAGILSIQVQSIADIFRESKINVSKSVSLHGEVAKLAFEEAIGMVESINLYAASRNFPTPKAALRYQSNRIIEALKILHQRA